MARVPGGVKDDDPIGAHQVNAEAARPGGHQEKLDGGVGVEAVDEPLPLQGARAPVQTVVVHPLPPSRLNGKGNDEKAS